MIDNGYRICDECKEFAEEVPVFNIDGTELCLNCAFDLLSTKDNMKKYINSDDEIKMDFYLNWLCNCHMAYLDSEKISETLYRVIEAYYGDDIMDRLYGLCKADKEEFIEALGYERMSNRE